MKPEFFDPSLGMCSSENPNTMGISATLKQPVDGDALKTAVEQLRERFPYFYVRAKVDGNNLIPVPNPLPVVIRDNWDPVLY